MKKTISAALAAVALAGMGAAQAQDAECHIRPECNPQGKYGTSAYPGGAPGVHIGSMGVYVNPGPSGPVQVYPNWGPYAGLPFAGVFGNVVPQYQIYERTRRDRDGDGIRNNRDRYPDDPRYR